MVFRISEEKYLLHQTQLISPAQHSYYHFKNYFDTCGPLGILGGHKEDNIHSWIDGNIY